VTVCDFVGMVGVGMNVVIGVGSNAAIGVVMSAVEYGLVDMLCVSFDCMKWLLKYD
jgi:hypothetical protein